MTPPKRTPSLGLAGFALATVLAIIGLGNFFPSAKGNAQVVQAAASQAAVGPAESDVGDKVPFWPGINTRNGIDPDKFLPKCKRAEAGLEAIPAYKIGWFIEASFSDEAALCWAQFGAGLKNSRAENELGMYYEEKKDFVQARSYFLRASEHGSSRASNNLAQLLESGLGGPKDENEATRLRHDAHAKQTDNSHKCMDTPGLTQEMMKLLDIVQSRRALAELKYVSQWTPVRGEVTRLDGLDDFTCTNMFSTQGKLIIPDFSTFTAPPQEINQRPVQDFEVHILSDSAYEVAIVYIGTQNVLMHRLDHPLIMRHTNS